MKHQAAVKTRALGVENRRRRRLVKWRKGAEHGIWRRRGWRGGGNMYRKNRHEAIIKRQYRVSKHDIGVNVKRKAGSVNRQAAASAMTAKWHRSERKTNLNHGI